MHRCGLVSRVALKQAKRKVNSLAYLIKLFRKDCEIFLLEDE